MRQTHMLTEDNLTQCRNDGYTFIYMKYSEIFYSIQGEGKLVGTPSVFFRTSFCNLRCSWCDSWYTSWEPEDKDISIGQAVEEISKFGCKHVVLTGGEPFVQKKEVSELCKRLKAKNHHITIETNATIFLPVEADLISMSPKLRNSIPPEASGFRSIHDKLRIQKDTIRKFLDNYGCQVKFVIDSEEDISEVRQHEREIPIPKDVIWLMPQGITAAEIESKQAWIVERCKEFEYKYSPRLHINIWGSKRGV